MIVCLCHGVSDGEINRHVEAGCRTVGEVGRACGAGTDCGQCACMVADIVRARRAGAASGEPSVGVAQQARLV